MTIPVVLAPEQESIVGLDTGAHLVVAPPGSGKTHVLTQRILRLLRASPQANWRILALTFTTRAAREMQDRLEAEAGDDWRRVQATTFHAFCLDVLQHYGQLIGVAPDVTIYEREDDRLEALARGLADDGLVETRAAEAKDLRRLLASIGTLKRTLRPPPDRPSAGSRIRSGAGTSCSDEQAYGAYERTLRRYGVLDFDDLLLLTFRLFTEHPRVAVHYRRMYRYILVDEAQDTSRAQYEILKALCGSEHRNVMLVADADQTIYKFAGASDKYLDLFVRDFGAERHDLRSNFRSAAAIVKVANRLIAKSPGRKHPGREMESEVLAKGRVEARSYEDEEVEGKEVANVIKCLLASGIPRSALYETESEVVRPEDIAVIARSRYLLGPTVQALESEGISYQFGTGQVGLFESVPYRAVYFGLRVVSNPRDLVSRANLVQACGLDDPESYADQELPTLFELLESRVATPYATVFGPLSDLAAGRIDLERFVSGLAKTDFGAHVTEDEESALVLADAKMFEECWRQYRKAAAHGERALSGFLGEISLAGRSAVEGAGVRVLTIHAAKGLEFRAVILVGLNQGSFPDFRSARSPESLAEEYRNVYVAVSRAARLLVLTRPRMRRTPWGDKPQEPSQFLADIGLTVKDVVREVTEAHRPR